jgi:hypothetical protein
MRQMEKEGAPPRMAKIMVSLECNALAVSKSTLM